MQEKIYDLSVLLEMEESEPGFVKRMIGLFLDSVPPLLSEMEKAYSEKDMVTLELKAHKIKSTLDIFGMAKLANNARQIEKLSKTREDNAELGILMDSLTNNLPSAFLQLKNEPF